MNASARRRRASLALVAAALVSLGTASPQAAAGPRVDAPSDRPRLASRTRPAATLLGCGAEQAICVHWVRGSGPSKARARAADAERAMAAAAHRTWRALERIMQTYQALDLPPPWPDSGRGGSDHYDLYLDPRAEAATTVAELPQPVAELDRAYAFSIAPPPVAEGGCTFDAALARALAEALLLALDPAIHPGMLALHASYLASLATPCSIVEIEAVDDFQRRPELPLSAIWPSAASGGMLFSHYLDHTYGTAMPGAVMTALLAASTQQTPAGSPDWHNEPDVFDTLRKATRERSHLLGDLLLDFAVARAFVGSRSDGEHLPNVERFGDAGRVRFEFSVPFGSLPRHLGPLWPVYPSGASYLWLDLADAPKGSQLGFVARWQAPVLFRWALVKVDHQGREVGRLVPPGIYGSQSAQLTVADLDDLAGLVIVGTNVGSVDRAHPFDPDDGPGIAAIYGVQLASL